MEDREYWRTVPGFPDYEVSNLGAVYHSPSGEELTPNVHEPSGLTEVRLRDQYGIVSRKRVAHLVGEAFSDAEHGVYSVSFVDGNPRNCRYDNLIVSKKRYNYKSGKES